MEQPALHHPPSTIATTLLEDASPLPYSPTSVTESLSSADTESKSVSTAHNNASAKTDVLTWENPRWKYFQEKRLRLSQQRVRLEQRLFEYADNDAFDNANGTGVSTVTPGGKQRQKLATNTKLQRGGGSVRKDIVFRTAKVLRKSSKICPVDNNKNRVSQEIQSTQDPTDPNTSSKSTKNNKNNNSTRTVIWSGALDDQTGQPHGRGNMVFPNGQTLKAKSLQAYVTASVAINGPTDSVTEANGWRGVARAEARTCGRMEEK
jgi:hypothetical protein